MAFGFDANALCTVGQILLMKPVLMKTENCGSLFRKYPVLNSQKILREAVKLATTIVTPELAERLLAAMQRVDS